MPLPRQSVAKNSQAREKLSKKRQKKALEEAANDIDKANLLVQKSQTWGEYCKTLTSGHYIIFALLLVIGVSSTILLIDGISRLTRG